MPHPREPCHNQTEHATGPNSSFWPRNRPSAPELAYLTRLATILATIAVSAATAALQT
jgi:hypothetical protein